MRQTRALSLGLFAVGLATTVLFVSPNSADAAPSAGFFAVWESEYPGSQTGANVVLGEGSSCRLCHVNLWGGGNNYNGYGKKMYDLMDTGSSVLDAIRGSAPIDLDGDPFGDTSGAEINANAQPGWTPGANNTHYSKTGITATNQLPPSAILGNLDICEAVATETVRLGSPANPDALRPGVTSRPIVGQTWDPVVDHTTFHPSAVLDVLAVDLGAPLNIPIGWGTLLCGVPPSDQIFSTSASQPFTIAVPVDCVYVGLAACAQAGSIAPGDIRLTNALDIVIGSY